MIIKIGIFQSTPSVWRETNGIILLWLLQIFQSTPSVWRETFYFFLIYLARAFQSTPSVWRETDTGSTLFASGTRFQSTPSVWRETTAYKDWFPRMCISIHSLRVEGDCKQMRREAGVDYFNPLPPCGGRRVPAIHVTCRCRDFNPLPPCGGRRLVSDGVYQTVGFQSTPSVWRETKSFV